VATLRAARRWSRDERVLFAVCVVLIVLGAVLRTHELGWPAHLTGDERHFVEKGARRYLAHLWDRNEHPPLGKLFIAASIRCFGDVAWAWRLPSLLAGIANVVVAGLLARLLFRERLAGALAAAFTALDGALIAYSRTACIDSGLVLFFLLSAFFAVRARNVSDLALASVFAGLATSVKPTGVVLVVPLVVSCFVHRARLPRATIAVTALAPLVYWLVYAYGLWLAHRPIAPWAETMRNFRIQVGLTDWVHPRVSHWSTWWLPAKPMRLSTEHVGRGTVRILLSLPNLAVAWSSFVVAVATLCRVAIGPRSAPSALRWLLLLWILPIVPWMLFDRDSYYNHYLPSYAFAIVLLGGAVAGLFRARPLVAWAFVGAVVAVFVAYLPLWIQLPIPVERWQALLFLELWR
jgi:dolichyl-phosphate-mannose--protein O-mannosyl transferase